MKRVRYTVRNCFMGRRKGIDCNCIAEGFVGLIG